MVSKDGADRPTRICNEFQGASRHARADTPTTEEALSESASEADPPCSSAPTSNDIHDAFHSHQRSPTYHPTKHRRNYRSSRLDKRRRWRCKSWRERLTRDPYFFKQGYHAHLRCSLETQPGRLNWGLKIECTPDIHEEEGESVVVANPESSDANQRNGCILPCLHWQVSGTRERAQEQSAGKQQ